MLPDVEELKKLFCLDSSIPEGLRWKIRKARVLSINDPAGTLLDTKYHQTKINGIYYLNHRIIYSIFNTINLKSDQIIDHIDRNSKNNNPANLRIVTQQENMRNQTKQSGTSSKFKGVCFNKSSKKFMAQIRISGKQIYLGLFQSEKDAALAYNNYIISNNLTHFNLNIIE